MFSLRFAGLLLLASPLPGLRQEGAQDPQAAPSSPPAPGATLAFVGGTLHTEEPGATPAVGTLLLAGDRILAVGPDVAIPEGTEVIDVTGQHLVPALLDGLVNFDPAHDLLYTATGVGFVRDIGGDPQRLLLQRDPEVRARALGPALATAGAVLDGDPPSSSTAAVLRTPEQAEQQLGLLFDEGVDFLSIQFGLSDEVRRRILELAHARGKEVWGPRPRELTMQESIDEGQDGFFSLDALLPPGVDWSIVQAPAFRKPIEALAKAGRPIIPLFYASVLRLENQAAREDTKGLFALLSPTYTSWWQAELEDRAARLDEKSLELGKRAVKKQAELLKALHEAGVQLVPGTGTPQPWVFPGRALHQELELWQEAGIPAADVLELATRRAAEALGVSEDFGTLAPGRMASFLLIRSDPTEDIAALREQTQVVARGQVIDRAGIDDLLRTVAERVAKIREAVNRPLDVEAPPVPEHGVVVLDGVVDTTAYGLRLWTEHFAVARLPDGGTAFLGRVVYPDAPYSQATPREMLVQEIVREGALTSASVLLRNRNQELRFEGIWTAESWRMRRTVGEESLGVTSHSEHPVVVDTGSVVTELVLGHAKLSDGFPVIALHEGLVPEAAHWSMELDDAGNHQVRTHTGRIAFRFDGKGAPEKGLSVVGTRALEFRLRQVQSFGGPGYPLPAKLRAQIDAHRGAKAEAEGGESARGAGGEQPGPERGGGQD